MKMTKSYKIVLLLLAFFLSITMAFAVNSGNKAYALSVSTVSQCFDVTGAEASFDEKGLTMSVESLDVVKFENNLIVNDMSIKMKLPQGFETGLAFDLASFYTNGNPKEYSKNATEGTDFDKAIKNIIKLSYDAVDANKVDCYLNDVQLTDLSVDANGYIVLNLSLVNGYFSVDGFDISMSYNADQKIYYKLQNIDDRAVAENITIDFYSETVSATGEFIMEYVDQKASDATGAYKQSFILASGANNLTPAKPRAYLSEDFYLKNADGTYSSIKKAYTSDMYELTITTCSVIGGYKNLYLVNPEGSGVKLYDNVMFESNTTMPNEFRFRTTGNNVKFGVGEKVDDEFVVYEEFIVNQVKENDYEDTITPVYVVNDVALASYENALKEAITIEKENGQTTSVALGTDFVLPSMKDLVFDDLCVYEELTAKVYYRTAKEDKNVSEMQFELDSIGDYIYFVAFSDGVNEMNKTDFFVVGKDNVIKNGIYGLEDDDGEGNPVAGYVGKFVFEFTIQDDADIEVKAPEVQGKGYKGIQYKASNFVLKASGCTTEYALYYNANVNAGADDEGWILIPKADTIADSTYSENGFGYTEIKKINYDGERAFLPTRIGAYKLVCTATSSVSSRFASASSIIKVESEPKVVEVPSNWLENNIWQIIFLSVGTACLIGIIILLCIKPKDKKENN